MTHNVFKILNQLDESVESAKDKSAEKSESEEVDDFDISSALESSIKEDKDSNKKQAKTWNKVDPQVKSISFFKTKNSENPLKILKITEKMFNFSKNNENQNLATKGFSRILPVL